MQDREDIIMELVEELNYAEKRHPPFNSAHEGFAILNEEVCSLWDEVRRDPSDERLKARMRNYAIKIGAMAIRFIQFLDEEQV